MLKQLAHFSDHGYPPAQDQFYFVKKHWLILVRERHFPPTACIYTEFVVFSEN